MLRNILVTIFMTSLISYTEVSNHNFNFLFFFHYTTSQKTRTLAYFSLYASEDLIKQYIFAAFTSRILSYIFTVLYFFRKLIICTIPFNFQNNPISCIAISILQESKLGMRVHLLKVTDRAYIRAHIQIRVIPCIYWSYD